LITTPFTCSSIHPTPMHHPSVHHFSKTPKTPDLLATSEYMHNKSKAFTFFLVV
jgi:hypothetical protein